MTKHDRNRCSTYDVYVEIIVERKIRVVAIDKEEALDLGLERIKTRSRALEREKNQKVVGYEVIDAVDRATSS
jgi:hypothetical protein